MKKAKSVQGRLESKNVTAEKDESIAQEIAHNKEKLSDLSTIFQEFCLNIFSAA